LHLYRNPAQIFEGRRTLPDPIPLSEAKIAILGLGLMGGSLAMALQGKCTLLVGADPQARAVAQATERKIVDQAASDPREILPEANVVILAAPVRAILQLLDQLPDLHPGEAVVLDLGSTKSHITQAMRALPERFDPMGGHPMCGKEKSSLEHAEKSLYQDAAFALTPLERTSQRAHSLVLQIVQAIGAHPLWLEPAEHDRWVAATSHMPFLLASALVAATPAEAASLIGPGYLSVTRLADSSNQMMMDILATNRVNILTALNRFQEKVQELSDLLAGKDDERLAQILSSVSAQHKQLIKAKHGGGKS
jgi:prephenate dehydrogenase